MSYLLEYKQTKGSKISSFLEWWEINKNKKLNITAKSNAIQLITIHKSKGLAFKVVFIPFNWEDKIKKSEIWVDSSNKFSFS